MVGAARILTEEVTLGKGPGILVPPPALVLAVELTVLRPCSSVGLEGGVPSLSPSSRIRPLSGELEDAAFVCVAKVKGR